MPRAAFLALSLLLATSPAAPLLAQLVVGELVERETDAPVGGAVVLLIDAAGERASGAMTGADGRYQLRAPSAGRYHLRAERIGYATVESEPLDLVAGQTLRHRFPIEIRPLPLAGIHVRGDRRCAVRPEDARRVAVLWDEAGKALRAARVTEEEALYIYVTRSYRQVLHPRRLDVTEEESAELILVGAAPYKALDPLVMAERGFLQPDGPRVRYYGPDAELLLSHEFLDTHCFGAAEAHPDEPAWVGVSFRPVPGRTLPEIAGVLWLDGGTAELRRIDFGYVGRLPFQVGRRHAGGRIDFDRLPDGAWYVRSWWIRIPETRRVGGSEVLRHVQIEGSEVVEIRTREGESVPLDPPGEHPLDAQLVPGDTVQPPARHHHPR